MMSSEMGIDSVSNRSPFSPFTSGASSDVDSMFAQFMLAKMVMSAAGVPGTGADQFARGGSNAFNAQQSPWAMNGFSPEMMLGVLVMLALNMQSDRSRSPGSGSMNNGGQWGSSNPVGGNAWSARPAAVTTGGTQPAATQPAATGVDPAATGGRTMTNGDKNVVPAQFGGQFTGIQRDSGCGPLAAVGTARALGMNPDIQQTFGLAEQSGWNGAGMNGPANYVRLLEKMGISARLAGSGSTQDIGGAIQNGKPVTISTAKHYFLATDYNPQTGQFYVGNTGTAMRGGKEWMTLDEISALGAGVNGVIYPN